MFGRLYQHTFERIYACLHRQWAEDLTSDVYLHALVGIRRYRYQGKPFIV
jgi:hypothetical protein